MKSSFSVELPWPEAALSLNSREHRRVKAEATRRYRHACKVATLAAAKGRKVAHPDGQFVLELEFRPPHKRAYDDDGLAGQRFKPGRDGMADALGLNDNQFHQGPVTIGHTQPWGAVIATLTETAEWRCSKCEGQHEPKWPCPYDNKTGSAAGDRTLESRCPLVVGEGTAAEHITSTDTLGGGSATARKCPTSPFPSSPNQGHAASTSFQPSASRHLR